MSISSAATFQSTSSLISRVFCWLGATETRARWLFKNSCLWDNYKLQAARGISWQLIVNSWARSFIVSVTESDQKSKDHSKPSLETEKIMLFLCRLKIYKMRLWMKFWLTVSTNGLLTRLCHKWNNFCLFRFKFGCAWLWLAEKFLRKGDGFFS